MSAKSFEVISTPRPIRYMFFIESDYESEKIIGLMQKLMLFWGGGHCPIIPVKENSISKEWIDIVKHFDPDYIGYTGKISEDFILYTCTKLELNPVEIFDIDNGWQSKGIGVNNLISLIDNPFYAKFTFLQSNSLWNINNPLIGFYKLNFLIDTYPLSGGFAGKYNVQTITPENFYEVNKIIREQNVFNNAVLSVLNSNSVLLRPSKYNFLFFEIVVTTDVAALSDLLYHWNKRLFSPRNFKFSTLLVTQTQLEQLLLDPYFGILLDSLPGEHNQINLVSFSIPKADLEALVPRFKGISKRNRIVVPEPFGFPFEIMDNRGRTPSDFKEKSTVQIIPSEKHLVYQAPLSFGNSFNSNNQYWCADIIITELSEMNSKRKFPFNVEAQTITGQSSRINRSHQISIINGPADHNSTWKINILPFKDIIRQVVIFPKLINEPTAYLYSHCSYNDSGNRLRQFIKLFADNFYFIEEFIYDKFWSDIFSELTNNTKQEGDTITFSEIIEKCIKVFDLVGGLKPRTESYRNEDNLRKGVNITLQRLVEKKIFLPGFIIKCTTCSSRIWYSLKETDSEVLCKGCSNKNYFKSELPISYKLNHLIKNSIGMRSEKGVFVPDGNLTAIKTLLYLNGKANGNFEYVPQFDIYRNYEDAKPVTDLDIACLVDGELYIGEAKHNSELFFDNKKKSLDNLLNIAATVRPKYIIISCTEDKYGKLHKAKQYLEHYISKWEAQPKVIAHVTREPDYFELSGGHNYFQY